MPAKSLLHIYSKLLNDCHDCFVVPLCRALKYSFEQHAQQDSAAETPPRSKSTTRQRRNVNLAIHAFCGTLRHIAAHAVRPPTATRAPSAPVAFKEREAIALSPSSPSPSPSPPYSSAPIQCPHPIVANFHPTSLT